MVTNDRQTIGRDDRASPWTRTFLAHPRAAGMSYFDHLRFAWSVGWTLLRAALAVILHGEIPVLCETYAGDTIRRLHRELDGTPQG